MTVQAPRGQEKKDNGGRVGKFTMAQDDPLIHERLKAPRAAAIAGMIFSLLLIASQLLVWISIPANRAQAELDVMTHGKEIPLALNLLPFAGIAFLWFIAVVRNRLGVLEDRFFATVFLGSGLLYIALIFTSAVLAGGLIRILQGVPEILLPAGSYALGRAQVYQAMNVYGTKMASVFVFSTSTILLRTRIVPRWMAFLGYASGALLLVTVGVVLWAALIFPLWVFLISTAMLLESLSGVSRVPQGPR
ncbi:MAG TPA: hypothetical protein VEJ67_16525 [Candidatus Cybelea sp.]|nr:hypothetical protein [Candidatus Cybelea sp.]